MSRQFWDDSLPPMISKGRPYYVTQDLAPGWKAFFHFETTESGAVTIGRVEVLRFGTAPEPDEGVTQAILRKITIGPAHRVARLYNPVPVRPSPLQPVDGTPTHAQLRKMLARYAWLVSEAKDLHPAKTLAAELKQPRSTVRTWIRRARRLPPFWHRNRSTSARTRLLMMRRRDRPQSRGQQ